MTVLDILKTLGIEIFDSELERADIEVYKAISMVEQENEWIKEKVKEVKK